MSVKAFLPEASFQIPVSGGPLTVFRFGSDVGKPILLIHGVTSSHRAFQLLSRELIDRGFSPYAVDLRGRGASNQLPAPFGMAVHAKDMKTVIDFFGWEPVDVIGHSMGAFVAVALTGLFPESVSKVTLVDGGIPLPMPPGMSVEQILPLVLGPALARLAMTFPSPDAYRDYWRPQAAFVKGWSAVLDAYVDYDLQGESTNLKPATNPKSVEEDSKDLFGSELISTTLSTLDRDVLFIRAERGLQNEPHGLYPMPVLDIVLPNYPRLKMINLLDTNHYDILLEASGAQRVAAAIYGDIP